MMARVALVSCINLFGAHLLNTFRIQVGAHQIIIWCTPINYLNNLVRAILFSAHQRIS